MTALLFDRFTLWLLYSCTALLFDCSTLWLPYSLTTLLFGRSALWQLYSLTALPFDSSTRWLLYSLTALLFACSTLWTGSCSQLASFESPAFQQDSVSQCLPRVNRSNRHLSPRAGCPAEKPIHAPPDQVDEPDAKRARIQEDSDPGYNPKEICRFGQPETWTQVSQSTGRTTIMVIQVASEPRTSEPQQVACLL